MPLLSLLPCVALLTAAPSESTRLRFAWPERLKTQVREHTTSRATEGTPGVDVTLRYPLTVETRGKERWLVPGPLEVTPPAEAPAHLGVPPFVVSPAGDFLRAEVPAPLVEALLKQQFPKGDFQRPADAERAREVARQLLEAHARQQWEALVGPWRGKTVRPGLSQKRKAMLESSLMGDGPIPAEERVTFELPVPCEPDAAEKRCVRIRRETVADAKALKDMCQGYEASLNETRAPEAPRLRVRTMELRTSLELVTEPDTLVPHLLREEQVDWLVTIDGDALQAPKGVHSRKETVFTPAK